MKALILNFTLKRTPDFSNTGAMAEKTSEQLKLLGIKTELRRLNDYKVLTRNSSDEGDGDQWPLIPEKIKACQTFIIATPIWMGHLASTSQR